MSDQKPNRDLSLARIREHIDACDHEIAALLKTRQAFVAQVAEAKGDLAGASPLRPVREAEQMAHILDWWRAQDTPLPLSNLIAIWREIIGAAITLQGGIEVYARAADMVHARFFFGASAQYHERDERTALARVRENPKAIAVLSRQFVETNDLAANAQHHIFATLPFLETEKTAYCFGAIVEEATDMIRTNLYVKNGTLCESKEAIAGAQWLGRYYNITEEL